MQYLPDGANLALMMQKIGAATPIIDYQGKQMALPASTMKVITALAALLELGGDYRFQTTFKTKGAISDGTLNGDLVARFAGDPTLSSQDHGRRAKEAGHHPYQRQSGYRHLSVRQP
nr:D-alanyl-D-alanine carboxypeptidase DacB precursor [Candidatus Pantoea persica]